MNKDIIIMLLIMWGALMTLGVYQLSGQVHELIMRLHDTETELRQLTTSGKEET